MIYLFFSIWWCVGGNLLARISYNCWSISFICYISLSPSHVLFKFLVFLFTSFFLLLDFTISYIILSANCGMLILSIGFLYFVEDLHGQGLLILEQCFCIQISENHNSCGLIFIAISIPYSLRVFLPLFPFSFRF